MIRPSMHKFFNLLKSTDNRRIGVKVENFSNIANMFDFLNNMKYIQM